MEFVNGMIKHQQHGKDKTAEGNAEHTSQHHKRQSRSHIMVRQKLQNETTNTHNGNTVT